MPIVLATILITVIALLLAVGKGIYDLFVYFRYMWSPSVPRVDTVIVEHLKENNYFLKLSLKGKKRFIRRVRFVAKHRTFEGRQGLEVADEMRVKISASLVQLTYGLRYYYISKFSRILIYPKTFYHGYHSKNLKGFASPGGTLALSWIDFLHGYEVPDDKYNLGLHELAHALHLNLHQEIATTHFDKHFSHWQRHSTIEFEQLRKGNNDFIRSYGGTNFHEFFAVTVEHFFEVPEEFYRRMPALYVKTCILLNQNPMNVSGDYSFSLSDFDHDIRKLTYKYGS